MSHRLHAALAAGLFLSLMGPRSEADPAPSGPCFDAPGSKMVWPSDGATVPRDAKVIYTVRGRDICEFEVTLFEDGRGVNTPKELIGKRGDFSVKALRPFRGFQPGTAYDASGTVNSHVSFTVTASLATALTKTPTLAPPLVFFHPSEGGESRRTIEIRTSVSTSEAETTSAIVAYLTNSNDDLASRAFLDVSAVEDEVARFFVRDQFEFADEFCIAVVPLDQTAAAGPSAFACASALANAEVQLPEVEKPGGCGTVARTPIESLPLVAGLYLFTVLRRRRAGQRRQRPENRCPDGGRYGIQ